MKELPKPEELLEGRMEDGSRPPLYSAELYEQHRQDAFGRKIPVELRGKSAAEMTAEELELLIEHQRLADYDAVRDAGRFLMRLGMAVIAGEDADASSPVREDRGSTETTSTDEPESTTEETTGGDTPPDMGDLSALGADAMHRHADVAQQPSAKAEGARATDAVKEEDAQSETDKPPASGNGSNTGDGIKRLPRMPEPKPEPEGKPIPGGQARKPDSPSTPPPDEAEFARRKRKQAEGALDQVSRATGKGTHKRKLTPEMLSSIPREKGANIVYTGSRMLQTVADKRAECAKRIVQLTKSQSLKQSFMWDRAHAVVASTLLHLDDEFDEVGFGSWMPFRYPDQWLMFVGVMRRVLAANGLIHSDNPEQYRKLLEETDPVVPEIEDINERIDWWRTPENWSTSWSNRGARTLEDLRQRLMDEVWDPTTRFGGTRAPPET